MGQFPLGTSLCIPATSQMIQSFFGTDQVVFTGSFTCLHLHVFTSELVFLLLIMNRQLTLGEEVLLEIISGWSVWFG